MDEVATPHILEKIRCLDLGGVSLGFHIDQATITYLRSHSISCWVVDGYYSKDNKSA